MDVNAVIRKDYENMQALAGLKNKANQPAGGWKP